MNDTSRTSIARQAITLRIKQMLADIAGLDPADIRSDLELAKAPLNYTSPAKLALAPRLNQAFEDCGLDVGPAQTASSEFVRDLRIIVERELRASGVEVIGSRLFGNLPNEN